MLPAHLIAHTSPRAKKQNVIFWNDYRLTVLSDRLFRLEKNEEKRFRDVATQAVWFRNMPAVHFSVKKTKDTLTVKTESVKLLLTPDREDCRVIFWGKDPVKIENEDNLGGTYRTLDCCEGEDLIIRWENGEPVHVEGPNPIPLGSGVCSRTGVAVYDDAASLSLGKNGEVLSERGVGTDEYIFAFGHDYRAAVQALYMITGKVPMLPRYALGNWWSRYHAYTDREYLTLLSSFERHDIPLTVATIDMDWHYSNNREMDDEFAITEQNRTDPAYVGGKNWGWTGYTWNRHLFPDHKQFLADVRAKNLRVTLNLHPADGVRYWEERYEKMANACGIDPATGLRVPFAIANPDFINAYFRILHKPLMRDGVDFFWIDWQQGTESDLAGLDPLWALNHYHYLDSSRLGGVPMILSRYAGIGSHRYPLGFSGDTTITWKTLAYLPYFTATASNVGYTWWSHDIGGHMGGETSDELFVRHLQFGVFSPVNRLHSTNSEVITKEPWCYGNGGGDISANFLRLRHAMIPFLYSCCERNHREGLGLIEPLYYAWDQPEAYTQKDEYLFGGQFIVAPVVTPLDEEGYAKTEVWLPEGTWNDLFTDDKYVIPEGGKTVTVLRELHEMPVFAPAGGFLPLSRDGGNSVALPQNLEVLTWTGKGDFTLYEDGREEGKEGEARTHFEAAYRHRPDFASQTVTVYADDPNGILPERTLTLTFRDIPEGEISVKCDGKPVKFTDNYGECVTVSFPVEAGHEYKITVEFYLTDPHADLLLRARRVLLRSCGNNVQKNRAWNALKSTETVDEYKKAVAACQLGDDIKARLTETL